MKDRFRNRSQGERMAIAQALMEALGEDMADVERYRDIQEAKKQMSFDEEKEAA